jgi:hypothetical protein
MNRRGRYSRKGRSFTSRVKKVIMKTAETKDFTIGIENVQLYHNMGQTALGLVTHSIQSWFNPWARIAKGTNSFNRIGDVITPRGMAVRIYWANKNDRPNTMLRLIVAVLPKLVQSTITTEAFDPFEQVQNFSDVQNVMCLNADKDRGIKFLYDKVHRMQTQAWGSGVGGAQSKEVTKFIKLWIRRKRSKNITFNREAQDIVNRPLAIYAIPYEQYDTSILSNVASIAGQIKMYFKDV